VREWHGRGPAGRIGRRAAMIFAAVALLAGCAAQDAEEGMRLRFEDRAEPAAFERTGNALRDDPDGPAGLWAAVPGLPRPERAEIVNLDTDDAAVVALFRASGSTIRVSNEAADALGLSDRPTPVRVTALRSVPEIAY
jgi:hypothetical protein